MKKITFVGRTDAEITLQKDSKQVQAAKSTSLEAIKKAVDVTNREIDALIMQAQKKAENETFETVDSIIKELVETTNKVSADMVKSALEQGYVVHCELVLVKIGNQSVWIDPLRVASF